MNDYKERLRQFNSTEKYQNEVKFLYNLIGKGFSHDYSLRLDYGSGLGHTAEKIGAFGYDVANYNENEFIQYSLGVLPEYNFKHIYFMHSFAHIVEPNLSLKVLKEKYPQARLTVITPNRHWLMMQSNRDYKPDPTVVRHYTMTELRQLFKECGYEVTLCGQFGEESGGINERIFLQAK